ncbi:hypothetical protein PY093_02685 [Cytobacillus sp. S13-E01]|uniref:hypothetical protein n=1 Tax=Cytobacillus sp. S13-E01 TaxID=3031326 RepID=UPI0023D8A197|nr:hypothetical protein [Cytobacillus sp. S13-E01]MDF0725620.1 hypothetical protein [Cytobacillus sp. S13-E01]
MRKTFDIVPSILISALLLAACAGPGEIINGIKVKNEINSYIEEISTLNEVQNTLLAKYEESFVQEPDNEKALTNLNQEIIPPFQSFLVNLKNIELETEEVTELHSLYIQAMELQLAVFIDFKDSLEADNDTLFDEANNKVDQVNELLDQHEKRFQALAVEYKVNLQFDGE